VGPLSEIIAQSYGASRMFDLNAPHMASPELRPPEASAATPLRNFAKARSPRSR
jgi:hypothetical protein